MDSVMRLAAVGDVHCTRTSRGVLRGLFEEMANQADVLLLCGDLTDYGLPEEAQVLAGELRGIDKPIIAVLGNHDFESGKELHIHHTLTEAGVTVLDGDATEVAGVGFAGVKGFCGGFDRHALEPWGEPVIKAFVQEAVNEALKLEGALARLKAEERVAILHYSPVIDTVLGEPKEILAYLGSRRLEDPLNRFPVHVVFHGHAHHGSPEGRTAGGTPVYNVALPLLRRLDLSVPPFRIVDVPVGAGDVAEAFSSPH